MRRLVAFSIFAAALTSLYIQMHQARASNCAAPQEIRFKIERIIVRSVPGYTQGLVYRAGILYESTGQYGDSSVNRINVQTGEVKSLYRLDQKYFGEGLEIWGNSRMLLTWKENTAFLWEGNSTGSPIIKTYPWEGWGLTHDSTLWITSDGTATVRFLDRDLKLKRTLQAEIEGKPQLGLNELEYVNGKIYANIYKTNQIVRINPQTGCVDQKLDISLLQTLDDPDSMPNGIAYDPLSDSFYIAGKKWQLIFQIKLLT